MAARPRKKTPTQDDNRTDGGRQYNAANEVVGFTYDDAGNLLDDGSTSYTYDALGRLTQNVLTRSIYNGEGVLVRQFSLLSVPSPSPTGFQFTQDLVAPLAQMLQVTNLDAATTSTYLRGQAPLATRQGPTTRWMYSDGLGSIRAVEDEAGVRWPQSYDPWGQRQDQPADFLGFAGEFQDPLSGTVHLRARWYNPNLGTFTSRDPFAGFDTLPYSLHPYQYAYSNPVLLTDPSGEFVPALIAAAALGIAAYAWLSNPSTVNAPAPGEATVASDHHAADMAFLETAPGTGDVNDVVAAATGRSFSGEPQNRALSAAAALLPLASAGTLRRALKMCTIELDDLAESFSFMADTKRLAGDYEADWWITRGARILEDEVFKQSDAFTCVGTCARIMGLPDEVADELEAIARANNPRGINFSTVSKVLTSHSITHKVSNYLPMKEAMPLIDKALRRGERVMAEVNEHAVVVHSVQKVGDGPRDWLVVIADPATGHMIELDQRAWSTVTGGDNRFVAIP